MKLVPLNAPTNGVAISGASGVVYVKPYGGFPVGYAMVKPSTAVKKRPAPARMLVFPGPPASLPRNPSEKLGEYATPSRGEKLSSGAAAMAFGMRWPFGRGSPGTT